MFNIVLYEPEIPENTANIGRTCTITASALHLIEPLGFILTKEKIRRAGMDYWDRLKWYRYSNYRSFLEKNLPNHFSLGDVNATIPKHLHKENDKANLWYASTKAHKIYTEVNFKDGDYIMFGKESKGIPEEILCEDEEHCIRIPMNKDERSLNLANSVAIVLYEAFRQNDFLGLEPFGDLHRLKYKHGK